MVVKEHGRANMEGRGREYYCPDRIGFE